MGDAPFLDMPLEEAMATQRAIRRLKPDPVDDALLLHVVELALKAPVGSNMQNWEFVLAKAPAVKADIADLYRQGWRVYSWLGRRFVKMTPAMERSMEAAQYLADHYHEAPVLIVPCKRGFAPILPLVASASWFASIYPSVQNLLLAARAAGLGATLTTLPLWNVRRLKCALGLPRNVTPCAVIPVGWPLGRYGPTTRRPVGEVVHVDRFGTQPFR